MGRYSSRSDQELFTQLEVIEGVATKVLERKQRGEELTEAGELAARTLLSETQPIIEELQQRGYGTC